MRSAIVCDGRFRVYEDGTVLRITDGKEVSVSQVVVNGYRSVTYSDNGKQIHVYVHRLVADGFLPADESRPHINHINGDRADNRVENLERVTPSENTRHAYATGLIKGHVCPICGETNYSRMSPYYCTECYKALKRKNKSEIKKRAKKERMLAEYSNVSLEGLPRKQRYIVALAQKGCTVPEIVKITNTTRQNVWQALKTAKKRMECESLQIERKPLPSENNGRLTEQEKETLTSIAQMVNLLTEEQKWRFLGVADVMATAHETGHADQWVLGVTEGLTILSTLSNK